MGWRDTTEQRFVSTSRQTEPHISDRSADPPVATSTPASPAPHYSTNVGDSLPGQRQLELQGAHNRHKQIHGAKAGKTVKLMKETDARTLVEDNSSAYLQAGGDHQAIRSGHYRRDQAFVDEYVNNALNAGKMFVDKALPTVGFLSPLP